MPSWGLSKYIKTKLQTTCFYLIESFEKTKGYLELVSLPHFAHSFWKKNISLDIYSINWHVSLSGWEICVLPLFVNQVEVMNFEGNLIFLIKLFFLQD